MKRHELINGKHMGYDESSLKEIEDDVLDLDENFDIIKWVDETITETPSIDEMLRKEQEEEEILSMIRASLAEQVCTEMDHETKQIEVNKKTFPFWLKLMGTSIGVILMVCFLLIITPSGRDFIFSAASNMAYNQMNFDDGTNIVHQEVQDDIESTVSNSNQELEDSQVLWDKEHNRDGARHEEGVVNILLLGEEAIESGGGRGRTDLMIIATMNTKNKSLKLTSLMRDVLVQIPGYQDNKLNAAYEIGGVPLLYETIELNFDVKLDGYAKVGFNDFESIINKLGGITIKLTLEEAEYLNKTNYISKPEYRNVTAGSQWMNGNQALGYCRVRYVPTGDKQYNDYGRTSRQRIVLNAIFDQAKSKSLPELTKLLFDLLPYITTDITKDEFTEYLKEVVKMGLPELENHRIPADHTFDEGHVRKMSVLIPDLDKNIDILHKFIFGSSEAE